MSLRSALAQRSGRARRWLARHWWLARHRGEAPLDPRAHQPPLPLPGGYTRAELLAALCTAAQDPAAAAELTAYLELDCDRFLYTLSLIPEDEDLLGLEIGAGPYFTTLLARWFRPRLRLELTNYFGGPPCERVPHVLKTTRPDGVTEEIDLSYANVNLEAHPLPFADARYDLVLFCEVLEHMTQDPLRCLLEIGRVLKPGGRLIVADFARHPVESLREEHAHRWLGFDDRQMEGWLIRAGLKPDRPLHLPGAPLTVTLWRADRAAGATQKLEPATAGDAR